MGRPNENPVPQQQPANACEMEVKKKKEEFIATSVGNVKEQVKPLGLGRASPSKVALVGFAFLFLNASEVSGWRIE